MARFCIVSNLANIGNDGELWRSYDKSMRKLYEVEELQGDQRYPRHSRGYCANRRIVYCASSVINLIDL